jgi:undecaprenyl-diphosphatase
MDIFQALILAIIQGITEWLPVSSSAHLAIAQLLMKVSPPVLFDILLHIGTLLSALIFFRKDIFDMLLALFKFDTKSQYFKLAILIILASIPTAIIGFAFKDFFEASFSKPINIAFAMMITGVFLFFCERKIGNGSVNSKSALAIGIAQGIAVMPGISRSGSTIGAGLLLGIEREKATRFSFLLSIPAIIGAAFFEAKNNTLAGLDISTILLAILVSAIVGYLSIDFLIKFVKRKGLRPFAYYCWFFGAITLMLSFFP